jgi:hypothetical protein
MVSQSSNVRACLSSVPEPGEEMFVGAGGGQRRARAPRCAALFCAHIGAVVDRNVAVQLDCLPLLWG